METKGLVTNKLMKTVNGKNGYGSVRVPLESPLPVSKRKVET
jgi:hypothetical protein